MPGGVGESLLYRTRVKDLFARTAEYFADALGADPGYTSVLFRNGPVHMEREGWVATYGGPPGGVDAVRAGGLDSGGLEAAAAGGDGRGPELFALHIALPVRGNVADKRR